MSAADSASGPPAPASDADAAGLAPLLPTLGTTFGASNDITASAAQLSRSESVEVGAYLFGAINVVFEHYPAMDEMGLILGMPADGTGRKKGEDSSRKQIAADPALASYHVSHPPPAAFLSLQAANGSPPFIVVESIKIGISFWAVPFIVKYTIARFGAARRRMKEGGLTAQHLVEAARAHAEASAQANTAETTPLHIELLQCTRIMLMINADNYSAWNTRKLLLSAPAVRDATPDSPALLLSPADEIRLLNLIYSKHPKSGESWHHRRWVLSLAGCFDHAPHELSAIQLQHSQQLAAMAQKQPSQADETEAHDGSLYHTLLFQSELHMCERSAELYPKNYFAWMHRQWLVERLHSRSDLQDELTRAADWTDRHINDYCGFAHRQVVWYRMLHVTTTSGDASSKGDRYAQVHAQLADRLRGWTAHATSQRMPNDSDEAQRSCGSESIQPPASSAAAAAAAAAISASASALYAALASCSFCAAFTSSEWSHINELQLRYPGHESLWMYRRFVWHATIHAIHQHDATPTDAKSTNEFPSWLDALIRRELEYAEFQMRDRDLSNYEANRTFAAIYKVWVMHSALSVLHRADDAAATPSGRHRSFPFMARLSTAHRQWYLSLLRGVTSIQPSLMSRDHWRQRAEAARVERSAQPQNA